MVKPILEPDQVHEWCRHIDTLMWTMGGILMGLISGLAIYAEDHPSLWISLAGLFLTGIVAFLIASFRAIRRRLHTQLDAEVVDLLRPPTPFKQWPVFLLLLAGLSIVWVRLAIVEAHSLWYLWVALGLANGIGMLIFFLMADRATVK